MLIKSFIPKFYGWFQIEKADIVVKCMQPGNKNGLGKNLSIFMSETLKNNVLKSTAEYKQQYFISFVGKMILHNLKKAFCGIQWITYLSYTFMFVCLCT